MDPNRSTTKGFMASLGALVVVLIGFFVMMSFGESDRAVTWPAGEDRGKRLSSESSESSRLEADMSRPSSPAEALEAPAALGAQGPVGRGGPNGGERQGSTGSAEVTGGGDFAPPAVDDPNVQKAIELVDQGKVSEATKLLEDVLGRDPKNEQALVEMAMINLLDLKQPDVALGYLQKVVEINPTNQIVLNELVSLYQEQGRVDDGLNYLMDLSEKKPGSSDLTYSIGQMLSLSGREQEAVPYIEKAAQSPVHQTRAYRDLAETYSHLGDAEKAIEFYDKAIASQEKDISERSSAGTPVTYAAERLGYMKTDKARVLIQKGDYDAAQNLLNDVRAQLPNDPNVAQLLDAVRAKKAG